jgi:hypothetical protein
VIGKFGVVALFLAGAWQASAGPILPYIDQPAVITAAPGDTIGWAFTIYNPTSDWISFTDSSWAQSTPSDGVYTDYIGPNGGPLPDFGIAPGTTLLATIWTQSFSPGAPGTGIGQFIIDPGAPDASTDTGFLTIHYDTFDASPNFGGNQTGGPYTLMLNDGVTLPTLSVDVSTELGVPEPSTTLPLALLGLGWIGTTLRRRFLA